MRCACAPPCCFVRVDGPPGHTHSHLFTRVTRTPPLPSEACADRLRGRALKTCALCACAPCALSRRCARRSLQLFTNACFHTKVSVSLAKFSLGPTGTRSFVHGRRAGRGCKLLSFERPALHEPDRQESPIWDRMGRQVLWWSMLECLSSESSRQRSQRSFGGGLAWHMGRGEVLAPNIQHGARWHLHATGR